MFFGDQEEKPPEPAPKAAAKGKAEPKAAAAPPEESKPGLPERQWQGLPRRGPDRAVLYVVYSAV